MLPNARPRVVVAAFAVLLVGIGLGLWWLWPSPQHSEPPRARQYVDYSACLLTDGSGLAGDVAGRAWQGMQAASTATNIKVFYVATTGANSVEDVRPFLAGLVQRKCAVIITAGANQTNALAGEASKNPGTVLIAVSDTAIGGGVQVVPTGPQLADSLRDLLISVVRASSGH